jgi:hypothetical protein
MQVASTLCTMNAKAIPTTSTCKETRLTDPAVGTLARGDDEDFAGGAGDRDGAAHDPRARGVFLAHEVEVSVVAVEREEDVSVGDPACGCG